MLKLTLADALKIGAVLVAGGMCLMKLDTLDKRMEKLEPYFARIDVIEYVVGIKPQPKAATR